MMQYSLGQNEKKNWIIAETAFNPAYQGKCEAIFCMGSGYLGQRAALEEAYVGQTRDMLVKTRSTSSTRTRSPSCPTCRT